jgi:hypothetical protein
VASALGKYPVGNIRLASIRLANYPQPVVTKG